MDKSTAISIFEKMDIKVDLYRFNFTLYYKLIY